MAGNIGAAVELVRADNGAVAAPRDPVGVGVAGADLQIGASSRHVAVSVPEAQTVVDNFHVFAVCLRDPHERCLHCGRHDIDHRRAC